MYRRLPLFLSVLLLTGCRQTYTPPVIANPPNYLVVEGFIENNGADSTVFTLSHTVRLDNIVLTPEPGARVTVEGSDNSSHPLGETGNGKYGAVLTTLNSSVTYRIHIVTSAGKQYASDYVPLVYNPPIDSINWVRRDNPPNQGVTIYTNTHDPQNNTHYYSWKYQEVWEFHSAFASAYQFAPGGGVITVVPIDDNICWKYNNSTDILLGSSIQLSQDVIYEAPLVNIPLASQQISIRYSILVTQQALTKDAFNWWQLLQKNTEQIGSIFGVQPSANPGNLHCLTDSTEPVLGYISGGNSRSRRIFITNDQVQPWLYNSNCLEMRTKDKSISELLAMGFLPIDTTSDGTISYSSIDCIECTLSGTNRRPTFW